MRLRIINVIFFFYLSSCSDTNSNKVVSKPGDTTQSAPESFAITRYYSIDPSKVFGQYALSYNPIQTDSTSNIDLPKLNDTLKFVIDSLLMADTSNLKLWTSLILIKQYTHHLTCCSQGFDNRDGYDKNGNLDKEKNPIIHAFLRLTNQLEVGSNRNEFMNSDFIYRYLLAHKELAKNNFIWPYFNKVDKITKR